MNPAIEFWLRTPPAQWQAWAAEHGTPLFVFDADVVAARVRQVRDALGGAAGVYFAVKSNPDLGLLRALADIVDGVDISSGGELRQALDAGFDAARMSFAGPGKTADELAAAVAAGVGCISLESPREIAACAAAARAQGRRASAIVRVNPREVHRAFGLKMGGRALPFGIDEDELPAALALCAALAEDLDIQGIHSYVGSQCFDPAGTVDATRRALAVAQAFAERSGRPCRKVNLGGGFGVAQSGDARALPLADAAPALRELLADFAAANPGCELFFELGRYLVAEAGIYVTRVVDAKRSRGTAFAVCDGGLNHQLAAAGTFGAALRGNFPLANLSRPDAPPAVVNVAGPSCNPTDLLGVQATLPEPHEGDLVGVAMSGAYGLSASPLLFLGHDTPVELVRRRGAVTVGRMRHTIADFN